MELKMPSFLPALFRRTSTIPVNAPATPGLYSEEAVDYVVKMLTRLPELDVVLKQAGIKRSALSKLLADDEIQQSVETRQDALLATPFRLEPSEGEASKLLMEMIQPHLPAMILGAFQARLYGYSVMEAVYIQRSDGKVGLRFIGEKPMDWFEPKSDGRLVFYANDGSSGPFGEEVDQVFKFFLTRVRPTYANPYGDALMSRLYWPFFFRNNGWKFWGKFLERFGSPLLVGKSSDPQKMVSALLLAHSNAVIGVGPQDEVKAEGVSAGNTGQAFDMFETAVIRRIQKLVLGQTLTSGTDGGSGNRALGQVHNSVREDKRNSDIQLVSDTVQRVVDALCLLNGFPKHTAIFADETGLESDRADRDTKLYQVGVRFTPEYIQDNYALREEDFEMTEDAPPPTGPVPAGSGGSPAKKLPAQASRRLGQHIAFSRRFTPAQEDVEAQGDSLMDVAGQPLPREALRAAIQAATSPEDLAERLFAIIGEEVSTEVFQEALERALFAADVLGYVHASGK